MKEIIEQYGAAIITFVVVIALIAVFVFLLQADKDGIIAGEFKKMIENFFGQANGQLPGGTQMPQ